MIIQPKDLNPNLVMDSCGRRTPVEPSALPVRRIGENLALQKIDVLALGRGNLTDNSGAVIMFTANNLVGIWAGGTTYAQYNVVEYSGRVFRSKIAGNLGNQPDVSPNEWETLYVGPKDGDVAIILDGANSSISQRISSNWTVSGNTTVIVALADGQVSPADAFVFVGSNLAFAKVEYTLKRGTGEGRKRKGLFNVLNDTATTVEYDHQFTDIGADVNVYMFWDMSGGNVRLRYTSGAEAVAIELKYTLQGWT